jgi:hypothetical protein
MVNSIGNVNAVTGAPLYTGRQLRQLSSPAFAGATAARPLGALTGVRLGTPSNTITATSTTWTAQPFAGIADVETLAIAGPYPFAFDTVQTGAVAAANVSNPRADIMYVQIDDPSEDASLVPAATLKYLAGTVLVGGILTAPLPVTRAFIVAYINVPISGGGSPSVTWAAPYVVAAGGILPTASSAGYPANATAGQYVDDASLGGLVRFDGSVWDDGGFKAYTPTMAGLTLGNGTLDSQYMRRGDYVEVEGSVVFGSTTSIPGPGVTISLPVPANAKYNVASVAFAAGVGGAILSGGAFNSLIVEFLGGNTVVTLAAATATGTYVNQSSLSSVIPVTWTTGAVLSWKFSYRTA